MADAAETLLRIPLFAELDVDEMAQVGARLQRERFAGGTPILQQGFASDKMYLLVEGRVRVLRKMGAGEVVITELDPTQSFGEMGIIDGEPASATVAAAGDVEVFSLRRQDFQELLDSSLHLQAKLWRNLARELTRRIRSTTNQVQDYVAINQALCENDTFRQFYKLYGP